MLITGVVKGKHSTALDTGVENGMVSIPLEAPRSIFLWLRVASKRMASTGCRARNEDADDKQHRGQEQYSYHEQLAPRVTEIHGPPDAVALRDKHRRIAGIIVKDTPIPVPVIISENVAGEGTITGQVRFSPETRSRQGQDEDDSN